MAEWRLRLKVERPADDVLIVFVKNDPEAQRSVKTGSTLFHLGNFDGKTIGGGRLTGDRKQQQQVLTFWPGNPHTHRHRARLAAFRLPALSFTHPQIGKPDHASGAKLVPAHFSSPSPSYASTACLTSSNSSSGIVSSRPAFRASALAVSMR